MKRMIQAALMFFMILAIAGCGGGGDTPSTIIVTQPFVTEILSNQELDGDIKQDLTGARTISPFGVQSVFAGIDPVSGEEFRAFLNFPLASVPPDARIVSAFLHITIDSIVLQTPIDTIPILIELVSFEPSTLRFSHFDREILRPLAFTTIIPPISLADVSSGTVTVDIPVDVTLLMAEAQKFRFNGLNNFQIRILEDFVPAFPGLIEINNTTGLNRRVLAPLLEVTYF